MQRPRPFVFCLLLAASTLGQAQVASRSVLNELEWRNIGPWRGGRSCAVSGVPGQPDHFYMGTTGGGVWKSTDAGEEWFNVSDGYFGTGSVGGIGVAPSQPGTVYVGMGETELRGNISHGDGVYRSDNGGETWRHLGLKETQSISRVRVHPTDPNTVWVAALGPVYGPSEHRGIYKTTDGGESWKKTLYVNDRSGGVDLSFSSSNPDVIYVSTWEAWRTAYTLNSGGPGSKMFKSTDGGDTWTEISKNQGLPGGIMGKIGIAVSESDPNRVYAMIEAEGGGLFKSDDAGATWELVNDDANLRQRPWYYNRVYVDPNDPDKVFVLNVQYHVSTNGGESFRGGVAGHSDHHDLWIDPANSERMIMASDGGACVSTNNGGQWTDQDYPTAQFYHVDVDNDFPYNVLGAQQDNSTVRIASRTFGAGITTEDWTSTAGGESGYVTPHPTEPWVVFGGSYGGNMSWFNHRNNSSRGIDPWPDNPMGAGAADLVHRMQWTFPIVFSPHNPEMLYTSSQHVMVSMDRGASWKIISPDLSYNEKEKQGPSGGPITKDNTSVEYYGTVFTLAESPKRRGVIWAGTDDGRVHITMNGGRNWTEITPPQMPKYARIRMVEASPWDAATAYLAVDNHEANDYAPYAYRTNDYGKTWTKIIGGLPVDSYVRVVREDPVRKGLLYAGLETGIWVSHDDGSTWQSLAGKNFPVVPVHNLRIKDDDLVVATHGRSFWILDDLSVLRQADQFRANEVHVFTPKPSHFVRFGRNGGDNDGPNPLFNGPTLRVWSPTDGGEVDVTLTDKEGNEVGTTRISELKQGLNEVGLRAQYEGFDSFPGLRMWAAGRRPITAPPGDYMVTATMDGKEIGKVTATFLNDPRSTATFEEMQEKFRFSLEIRDATSAANNTVVKIRELKEKLSEVTGEGSRLSNRAEALIEKLSEVEDALHQGKAQSGQDFLNYPIRINNKLAALLGNVQSGQYGPTKQSYQVYEYLKEQLDAELKKFAELEKQAQSVLGG